MKKLILLSLISLVLAGLGNMVTHSLGASLGGSGLPASGWAMFKELFQ